MDLGIDFKPAQAHMLLTDRATKGSTIPGLLLQFLAIPASTKNQADVIITLKEHLTQRHTKTQDVQFNMPSSHLQVQNSSDHH